MADTTVTFYDYTEARKRIAAWGKMRIDEDDLLQVDIVFNTLGLEQDAVTTLIVEHAWRMRWQFNPSNYSIIGRIKLALHFLFGSLD